MNVRTAIELSLSLASVCPIWQTETIGPKNLDGFEDEKRGVALRVWLHHFNELHTRFNEEDVVEEVDDQDGGILRVKKVDPENGLDQIRIYYQSTLWTSVQSFQSAANTFTI